MNPNETASHIDPFMTQVETVCMFILFSLTAFGNICCILTLLLCKRPSHSGSSGKRISRMSFYIMNLSIADVLVALLSVLPTLFWRYNVYFSVKSNAACKLVSFFGIFPIYLSTLSLLLMAHDRYKAICQPFKSYSWSYGHAFVSIAISWLLALIISSPQLYLFALREIKIESINTTVVTCSVKWLYKSHEIAYVLLHTLTQFILPLILLCFFYTSIFVAVKKSITLKNTSKLQVQDTKSRIKKIASGDESLTPMLPRKNSIKLSIRQNTSTKALSRAKMKTLKLTLSVVIAYFLCCLPFYIFITTHVIINSDNYSRTHGKFFRKIFANLCD